jgi:hypothetical protein
MFAGMDSAASPSFPRPAESSPDAHPSVAASSPTTRSRITNGKQLLANIDGRSAEARRYKDLCLAFADDCGGASALTEGQRALVRSAAALSIQSEKLQGAMIRGEAVSDEQMTRVANSLARTLQRLALKRAPAKREASTLAEHFSRPVQRSAAP